MADELPPAEKTRTGLWRPISLVFATIGLLTVLALGTVVLEAVGVLSYSVLDWFDTDEAPIRVRNGSLDFELLSEDQEWKQVANSRNWRVGGGDRFTDNFEVTVAVKAGADCSGSLTATGSDIVLTYNNGEKIRLQSHGKNTWIKPDSVTLDKAANAPNKDQLIRYTPGGFLHIIAVGNGANPTRMCTFTAADQLDHVIILNVPQ